jgi:hypothetical protein
VLEEAKSCNRSGRNEEDAHGSPPATFGSMDLPSSSLENLDLWVERGDVGRQDQAQGEQEAETCSDRSA